MQKQSGRPSISARDGPSREATQQRGSFISNIITLIVMGPFFYGPFENIEFLWGLSHTGALRLIVLQK